MKQFLEFFELTNDTPFFVDESKELRDNNFDEKLLEWQMKCVLQSNPNIMNPITMDHKSRRNDYPDLLLSEQNPSTWNPNIMNHLVFSEVPN